MSRKVLLLLLVVLLVPSCALFRKKTPPPEPLTFAPDEETGARGTAEIIAELDELRMARTHRPAPARRVPPPVHVPTPRPTPRHETEPLRPALAAATYKPEADVVGTVVAVVNGDIITKEDVLSRIRLRLAKIDADSSLTPAGKQAKRKQLISTALVLKVERLLALQQARRVITLEEDKRMERDVDSIVKDTIHFLGTATKLEGELAKEGKTIDEQKRDALDDRRIRALLAREVDAHVYVTPAEMQKFYAEHRKDYTDKAQVKIRQIFLKHSDYASREEAVSKGRDLLTRIRKQEDFGKLAREYSDGPYAKKGGLWEFVTEGSGAFRPEVERVAFKLRPKAVSDAIVSEIGVHVIKAEDVKPARMIPFAEAQDEIAARLRREKRERLYREFIKKLWDKSYVDIRWR